MLRALPVVVFCLAASAADPLIQVGTAAPVLLDLRGADVTRLVPSDPRDPAQGEAARRAWSAVIAPVAQAASVRLRLPGDTQRIPLLLGACQALKAARPDQRVYIAFDPVGAPVMDEAAWGAVDGGALTGEDLGADANGWRDQLLKAQERFPGRPWFLWTPSDPEGRAASLLGDGGRLVVPAGGPSARLARLLPAEQVEVEGGQDVLALRSRGRNAELAWRFERGDWQPVTRTEARNEVTVTAEDAYDVAALVAKMRAAQLRDRAALRSLESTVRYDMHFQGERGSGDMGFTFRGFERAGEPEELLRKEVRFNGVKAKLGGDFQLPVVEARSSVAIPVALALTERYRYEDAGSGGAGRRLLRFKPVDGDPMLFTGELLVDEVTGRVLEERSQRDGLPGMVRSENRVLTYGAITPGLWRVVNLQSRERWAMGSGVVQVHRTLVYQEPKVNDPGFEQAREAARGSDGSILRQTTEGFRYFVKQADGSRKVEEKIRTRGRAVGGVVLMDPDMTPPVLPLAGLMLWDWDAFGKGIQYNLLTAVVFNHASLMVPNVGFGVDFSANATVSIFKGDERPSKDGKELEKDAVSRRTQSFKVGFGRDLGAGFRLALDGQFLLNTFGEAKEEKYRTPGFQAPPSGWTRMGTASLSWQGHGFQARAFTGQGQRPNGTYGTPEKPLVIADEGRFKRYGGTVGYDLDLGSGRWLTAGAGMTTGRGFDRFASVDVSEFVQGIKSHALATDRVQHADVRFVVPTGPRLRLTLGLEHARARSLDDRKTYGFTGATLAGDLPGFGWFSTVRVDLGVGLQAGISGTKGVQGTIALLRLF